MTAFPAPQALSVAGIGFVALFALWKARPWVRVAAWRDARALDERA